MRENMGVENFNGRNFPEGLSENLRRVVSFLLEKETSGDFVYSTSVADWEKQRSIIVPLNLANSEKSNYFLVGISHIASINDGILEFSEGVNLWTWANAGRMDSGTSLQYNPFFPFF